MTKSALIGHTGFVGSNLRAQHKFGEYFNSSNFRDMTGRQFDLVVCAGLYAAKWVANRNPEEDRGNIAALESALKTVEAGQFVLISTVDVYPVLVGVDEGFDCHAKENHAYGRNRLAFEDFITTEFRNAFVIRLPGLFGPRLKKNVLFDLLHDNCLEMINPQSVFQWYDITHLWRDVQTVVKSTVRLVNLVNEPMEMEEILNRFFPHKSVGSNPSAKVRYDIRTRHADVLGSTSCYILHSEMVLQQIGAFLTEEQERVCK